MIIETNPTLPQEVQLFLKISRSGADIPFLKETVKQLLTEDFYDYNELIDELMDLFPALKRDFIKQFLDLLDGPNPVRHLIESHEITGSLRLHSTTK